MKKIALWLLIGVLTGCCAHGVSVEPKHTQGTPTFVPWLKDMTVALTHEDEDGDNTPYCSGVWIAPDKILTAAHCVNTYARDKAKVDKKVNFEVNGTAIEYVIKDDVILTAPDNWPTTVRKGIVTAVDFRRDLALIDAPGVYNHAFAKFNRFAPLADGTHVNIVGHTAGFWWTYFGGTISTVWGRMTGPTKRQLSVFQISSPTYMGNSGGGAFDDEGNLIGIASWIMSKVPNMGFYVSREEIIQFINHPNDGPFTKVVVTPAK